VSEALPQNSWRICTVSTGLSQLTRVISEPKPPDGAITCGDVDLVKPNSA
jgi:hypothetical protein